MNKSTKRLALLFFSLMASSVAFFSCTDVDNTLGLELIPDNETRDFKTYTLYPDAYTVTGDSINTSTASTFMIGTYYDPMFGEVVSGSAFQLLPYIDSMDFGAEPTYESLTLQLVVNNIPLGDENIAQKITVYELTERLHYNSTYKAGTPIKNMIDSLHPIASTIYNGEDTLKIELGPAFANKLLTAKEGVMAHNNDTLYNSPFFDYMKGLYVVAEPVAGETGRMNYFSPEANLYLTYSNIDSTNITRIYDNIYTYDYNNNVFYFSMFNAVKRDYGKADPSLRIHHLNDTTATGNGLDSVLYLQGFFGAMPYIKISSQKLEKWLDSLQLDASQVSIIRAELVMELDDEFNGFDITKYPKQLGGMTRLNPLTAYNAYYGSMYVAGCLNTFYYALSSFDGRLNTTHKKYSFNITHEIIDQLKKGTDLAFYLAPYASNSGETSYNTLLHYLDPPQNQPYKAVMRGTKHSKPLKLVISYAIPY